MNTKQVSQNWSIPKIQSIKQVFTGLLNQTYIIRTADKQIYVLQQLHPAVSMLGSSRNYFHVTQFLDSLEDTLTQTLVLTKSGKYFYEETKNNTIKATPKAKNKIVKRWRLLKGVDGNVYTVSKNPKLAYEAGLLLSKFHSNLLNYPKPLAKTLPMFQYKIVLKQLKNNSKVLLNSPDLEIASATKLILKDLPKLLLNDNLPKLIIHTDPKISNFVFDNKNQGLCMIDLDTIQRLSPLYDIGDALRSWSGLEEDNPSNKFNKKVYSALVDGYLSNTKHPLSKKEIKLIPQACKLVTLGLAARFLNDYHNDNYFGWDETRYHSRKSHNKARTLGQLSLYRSLVQEKLKKF